MKCTPQNTMSVAVVVVRRESGKLERVADHVGPADHFVALVVVAEDQEPITEGGLGGRDASGHELVFGREGVVVRQRNLETQHVGLPPLGGGSSTAGGWQPGRQHRGGVGLGAGICPPDTGPAVHADHNTQVEKDCHASITRQVA